MAKVLESFDFSNRGGPRAKHDWPKWLNGQIYALSGDDFKGAKWQTFLVMLRRQAKDNNKSVQAQYDSAAQTLYFKVLNKDGTPADNIPEDENIEVLEAPADNSDAAPPMMGQADANPVGENAAPPMMGQEQADANPVGGNGDNNPLDEQPMPEPEPTKQGASRGRRRG